MLLLEEFQRALLTNDLSMKSSGNEAPIVKALKFPYESAQISIMLFNLVLCRKKVFLLIFRPKANNIKLISRLYLDSRSDIA